MDLSSWAALVGATFYVATKVAIEHRWPTILGIVSTMLSAAGVVTALKSAAAVLAAPLRSGDSASAALLCIVGVVVVVVVTGGALRRLLLPRGLRRSYGKPNPRGLRNRANGRSRRRMNTIRQPLRVYESNPEVRASLQLTSAAAPSGSPKTTSARGDRRTALSPPDSSARPQRSPRRATHPPRDSA